MGIKYTDEMINYLRNNIFGISHREMTERFNCQFGTNATMNAIKGTLQRHGFKSASNGRFEKGHTPFNKGEKGVRYKGCEKTWFKKGHIPQNHKTVGSERISKDGYIEIKIAEPNKWALKHRVVWENVHGPLPTNYVLIFLDQNKLNINIENLKLVTRGELAIINKNRILTLDPELNNTSTILAKLMSTKSQLKRGIKHGTQIKSLSVKR